MKPLHFTLIVLAFLFLSCSSGIKVTMDYDKTKNFSDYNTFSFYGWAEDSDAILNPLSKQHLENGFRNEFEKRGISYVEEGGDLVVSLFVVTETKTATQAYTNHYGSGGYYYGYHWGWGMGYSTTTYHDYDYNVGTLVCDVFDAEEKVLIWQGVGSATIDDNPNTRDRMIKKLPLAIMYKFPRRPGR